MLLKFFLLKFQKYSKWNKKDDFQIKIEIISFENIEKR